MGKSIFVSYKYADAQVQDLEVYEVTDFFGTKRRIATTARHYVDEIAKILEEDDHIYKGENDGESMVALEDATIASKLGDKIFYSSITIVLVSHNMDDVAAHADRVLIMEDGTLKMDGTTREIFARKDDLTTTGLGLPQTVEFYLELRKMQIQESIDSNRQTLQNENAIPLTIEELAECITGGSK